MGDKIKKNKTLHTEILKRLKKNEKQMKIFEKVKIFHLDLYNVGEGRVKWEGGG